MRLLLAAVAITALGCHTEPQVDASCIGPVDHHVEDTGARPNALHPIAPAIHSVAARIEAGTVRVLFSSGDDPCADRPALAVSFRPRS